MTLLLLPDLLPPVASEPVQDGIQRLTSTV